MSTDSIQGLVTGALLGDDFEETAEVSQSLQEIASESTNEALLLAEGREVERTLTDPDETSDPDAVRNLIARFGAMYIGSGVGRGYHRGYSNGQINGTDLLMMALDYADEPSAEKIAAVREAVFRNNNYMEANQISRSTNSALDYLEQIWGDGLVDRLSVYTRTKTPTVKKWIRDQGNPSSSSATQISDLARAMFELQAGCGMTRDEAVKWWDAPNPDLGGDSPHKTLVENQWGWSLNQNVKDAIGKAGGGIGYRKD